MTRNDDERVADILEATTHLAALVDRGRSAFDTDTAERFAIERLLEITGEGSNAMSAESRDRYPSIDWADITRLRIVLAHASTRIRFGRSRRATCPAWHQHFGRRARELPLRSPLARAPLRTPSRRYLPLADRLPA